MKKKIIHISVIRRLWKITENISAIMWYRKYKKVWCKSNLAVACRSIFKMFDVCQMNLIFLQVLGDFLFANLIKPVNTMNWNVLLNSKIHDTQISARIIKSWDIIIWSHEATNAYSKRQWNHSLCVTVVRETLS